MHVREIEELSTSVDTHRHTQAHRHTHRHRHTHIQTHRQTHTHTDTHAGTHKHTLLLFPLSMATLPGYIIPYPVIKNFLDDVRTKGKSSSVCDLGFSYELCENKAMQKMLKLTGAKS